MLKKFLLALVACTALTAVNAAEEENLLKGADFEVFKGKLIPGFTRNPASKHKYYKQDTTVFHGGKASLCISGCDKDYVSFVQIKVNVEDFKHPLKLTGWVKYENLVTKADGKRYYLPFIGLWSCSARGSNSAALSIGVLKPGSRDWFKFEKIFTPEDFAKVAAKYTGKNKPAYINFRINVYNQPGTIWLDDLVLTETE